MTARDRFVRTLNFQTCDDRLPMVEWAAWWDLTIDRWKTEGLPKDISWDDSLAHFGLDPLVLVGSGAGPHSEVPAGISRVVTDEASYDALRPHLFTDVSIANMLQHARRVQASHTRGDIAIRLWLDGYFWFPRAQMGIEQHMLAFFDQPELMHRMNRDLADYNLKVIDALCRVLTPDTFQLVSSGSCSSRP